MIGSTRISQWTTIAALTSAILITRVGHFGTFATPPDATLAAFFLAGLWVRTPWVFALLLGAAGIADQIAFAQGVSAWCVSAAYGFLMPTYACLWFAGRASRSLDWHRPLESVRGAGNLLASLLAAFVISSGSFFLLSNYFPGMSGTDYWLATAVYVPRYVGWAFAYAAAAVFAREVLVVRLRQSAHSLGT